MDISWSICVGTIFLGLVPYNDGFMHFTLILLQCSSNDSLLCVPILDVEVVTDLFFCNRDGVQDNSVSYSTDSWPSLFSLIQYTF